MQLQSSNKVYYSYKYVTQIHLHNRLYPKHHIEILKIYGVSLCVVL